MSAPGLLVVLLGPTASGKSELGVALAERLGGEVVNFDSRQVYRGLCIGTGKPTTAERRGIPHHLFDEVEPDETYSAARFALRALETCQQILARGRLPILVGGTGLYLRALLQGLFEGPGRDVANHQRLGEIARRGGLPRLYRWLEKRDPQWARRVGPGDRQRILRGLDVWLQSGRTMSEHIVAQAPRAFPFEVLRLGLAWPREQLHARIEARSIQMLRRGWLEEVERLARLPGFAASNAGQALGYRQLLSFLAGTLSLEDAQRSIQRDTRRLAKRQMTWFRREPDVHWLPATDQEALLAASAALVQPRLLGLSLPTAS